MAHGQKTRSELALTQRRDSRPLSECPHCDSHFVHPISWRERGAGSLELELRCPECLRHTAGVFAAERVRELDATLQEGRKSLREWHVLIAARNMRETIDALREGLERGLITADDFAVAPR